MNNVARWSLSVTHGGGPACYFTLTTVLPIAIQEASLSDSLRHSDDVLERLLSEIHRRAKEMPDGSYTTKLIAGGVAKMGAKVVEEAAEVVEAAEQVERDSSQSYDHLIYEACDLIYHLWVLLGSRGITLEQLRAELARREGTSGLEEKRQRGQSQS